MGGVPSSNCELRTERLGTPPVRPDSRCAAPTHHAQGCGHRRSAAPALKSRMLGADECACAAEHWIASKLARGNAQIPVLTQ